MINKKSKSNTSGRFFIKGATILFFIPIIIYTCNVQIVKKETQKASLLARTIQITNTTIMTNLSLIREEREPIRESYFRTYVYKIKDGMLYYKRFSWGRISENLTEHFKLSADQLQLLQKALNNPKFQSNFKEFIPSDDSNFHLTYKLNIETDGKEISQHISSPEHYIHEKQKHIDDLWKLVANFIPIEKPINSYSPITTSLDLDLTFKEIKRSKDTETKIRKYTLRGNTLNIELIQKGRFKDEKKATYQITDEWLAHLANYIVKEKEFVDGDWFNKTPKSPFSYLFPVIECEFSVTIQGETYNSNIKGDRFALLESIPFIILECIEKLLDPENEFHNSFEKDLRNQRFKKALEKFEKDSKN